MTILGYLFLYTIILSISVFYADIFQKKIEKTIFLSFISITLLMYLFGIIGQLQIGVIIVSILSILLLAFTIFKNIKKHTLKNLEEKTITTGSIFFTIIFFVFIIATLRRELTNWDQFTYWSIAAKDMFNTNQILMSIQDFIQYPPIPAVLQYFFMKIIGEYSQGIEIFTMWILGISFLLPLFEKTNGKKIATVMISLIILCVPAVFQMLIFYESSYPDALLGIIIGELSYFYFSEKTSKYKTISILLTFAFLTLTKPTGIVIALILWFTLALFEVLAKRNLNKKIKEIIFSKEAKILFVTLIVIVLIYTSWIVYRKIVDFKTQNTFGQAFRWQ